MENREYILSSEPTGAVWFNNRKFIEVEALVGEIEKMKKECLKCDGGWERDEQSITDFDGCCADYNQALTDIKTLLTKE